MSISLSGGNEYLISTTTQDLSGLLIAFVVMLAVGFGQLILFALIRNQRKDVYNPKNITSVKKNWILDIFSWKESADGLEIGLDAYMYLRFLKFLCQLFLAMSVLAIPLTIFNAYSYMIVSDEVYKENANVTATLLLDPQLSLLAMGNFPLESRWFYLYTVVTYVISFLAYFLLIFVWNDYDRKKCEYYDSEEFKTKIENRMLLITNIPERLRSKGEMMKYLAGLDSASAVKQIPLDIILTRDYRSLPSLVHKHSELTIRLERVLHYCKFIFGIHLFRFYKKSCI
jgi:hypothetical protein